MTNSSLSCDVFIPLHPKDARVIVMCIQSMKKYVTPKPGRIFVLAREVSDDLRKQLISLGAEILDEDKIGDLPPRTTFPDITCKGIQRAGWYYQQFLKFEARKISTTPAYLVVDADTVFVRPISFIDSKGRYLFDQSGEFHKPYFDTFERLLGWRPQQSPSYIINYLIFDVALVTSLINDIEKRNPSKRYWDTILSVIDRTEMSAFSEFETYGYWLEKNYPERFVRSQRGNRHSKVKYLWLYLWYQITATPRKEWSVSYHNHRRW
jgi:Family of unknown function (DUF6492)